MINAMTVDVEEHFHVSAFSGVIDADDWSGMPSRVERNTERLLQIFDEADSKATFFVLGWVGERYPGLVRRIVDAGHELACHGWSHELVYNQDPGKFSDETRRAKAVLEQSAGESVIGYRAASYSITGKSLWALDILAELGFQYDSSIFPVRHDVYGIAGGERWPHRLKTPGGGEIVEFPISTATIAGARLPIAGGGYFRLFPYFLTQWGLKSINRQQQPFVFYLHPWEVDPEQPRIENAPLKSRLRHYTNLDRSEPRLRQLMQTFEFGTCREVLTAQGLLSRDPAEAARHESSVA